MEEISERIESASSAETRRPAGTLASRVYENIRADVLRGVLVPGEKLRIERLCRRYGAGSSPIREALIRLSVDGIVTRIDQKGFRVPEVSRSDLRELTHTRCLADGLALRESIRLGHADWEDGVVLAMHRLSRGWGSRGTTKMPEYDPEWEGLHRDFHASLIAGCESTILFDFCMQLFDRADRYRQLAIRADRAGRDVLAEHRRIADAAIARDSNRAVQHLTEHYRNTEQILLASVAKRAPASEDRELRPV